MLIIATIFKFEICESRRFLHTGDKYKLRVRHMKPLHH